MDKHTPGPWVSDGVYVGPAHLPTLIIVNPNGMNYAEVLATGNLIAAAPDLLEALREIAEQAEYRLRKGPDNGDEQTLRIARAAIAKATE